MLIFAQLTCRIINVYNNIVVGGGGGGALRY